MPPRAATPAAPGRTPVPGGSDLSHLPGAWIGAEVFAGVESELAEAERFFCTFDLAPERCSRRECRQSLACLAEGPAGTIHRECRGKPGAHVRSWVVGLWLLRLHDVMQPERAGEGAQPEPAPPTRKRRRGEPAPFDLRG